MRTEPARWWKVAVVLLALSVALWAAPEESDDPETTDVVDKPQVQSSKKTAGKSKRTANKTADAESEPEDDEEEEESDTDDDADESEKKPGSTARSSRPARPTRTVTTVPDAWPPRAIWITRRAWQSQREIRTLMQNCSDAGFNTVLFQVRGNGTVFYHSKIEPLAYEFPKGQCDFDPLEVAVEAAHEHGMALHAWVNLLPGWYGAEPPADPKQLYNAHPDWFLYDRQGKRQPLGWYVSLNPCLPEVREYLVRLCQEILQKYKVDGLHLDYMRLALEKSPKTSDYPQDEQTLTLYGKETRHRPEMNPKLWAAWRSAQISRLLYDIRVMAKRTKPQAYLSVSCTSKLKTDRDKYFQDAAAWVRCALVDVIYVMNYTSNTESFAKVQGEWLKEIPGGPICSGISIFASRRDATIEKILMAEQWPCGFAIFSDAGLFDGSKKSTTTAEELLPVLKEVSERMDQGHGAKRKRFTGRVTRSPLDPRRMPLLPPEPVKTSRSRGGRSSRGSGKITYGPAKPATPAVPDGPAGTGSSGGQK